MIDKPVKDAHQSYGMLQFKRSSSSAVNLFGSSIKHRDTIKMSLHEGCVERTLSSDFYTRDKLIVEVEMSYSQFAEAITSMNVGSGVPVTIRWEQGIGAIEPCPFIDKKEQFEHEFQNNLNNANESIDNLIHDVCDMFKDKKNLSKADKENILSKLNLVQQAVNDNNAFIYRQFNTQMDKTVTEAKGEIEAFMQNKINSIAQTALVEQRDSLPKTENPVCIGIDTDDERNDSNDTL